MYHNIYIFSCWIIYTIYSWTLNTIGSLNIVSTHCWKKFNLFNISIPYKTLMCSCERWVYYNLSVKGMWKKCFRVPTHSITYFGDSVCLFHRSEKSIQYETQQYIVSFQFENFEIYTNTNLSDLKANFLFLTYIV